MVEATKIPSEWHIWIHYKSNKIPSSYQNKKFFWQKEHIPNLTGTKNAHIPTANNIKKDLYQSWNPS